MNITGSVVSSKISNTEIFFFVNNEHDLIQSHHARGEFYETEELSIIAEYFPRGGIFCDIGTNIANHTIYVSKFLHPLQVIIFEPNPAAIPILQINLLLNNLTHIVDGSNLGVGLSDDEGRALPQIPQNNLGATRMIASDDANALRLVRGDDCLAQRRIDFIKMDVEGMEMRALNGMEATIARWRPPMFIEVDDVNKDAFETWRAGHDYVTVRRFRRYPVNENYMIFPIEKLRS